jgi:asparagine synthase (glutamine-hydrolysing)
MCGFIGAFSKDTITDQLESKVHEMNSLISHRGPDSKGYYRSNNYACAFSRLSIIDLDTRANQPFHDPTGRFTLVFNGEIYNYLELKEDLGKLGYHFATQSDTEVLLNSFLEWGVDCVNKFTGMFAFAIYDHELMELFVFRDQLGIKPVYYMILDDVFYLSSELKPFTKVKSLDLNSNKFIEYLSCGSILGPETLFKNIKELEPGNYIRVDSSLNVRSHQYFNLAGTLSKKNKHFNLEELEETLNKSVVMHMRCDVEYGVQLSGGLDSSLVTAMAAIHRTKNQKNAMESFSVELDCQALDESPYQKIVSDQYKTHHNNYVFRNQDMLNSLIECIWMYDYPLHHPNIVPSFLMNDMARKKNIKVLLAGDGADELFVGYSWSFSNDPLNLFAHKIIESSYYTPAELNKNIFKGVDIDLTSRFKLIEGIEDPYTATTLLNQRCYLDKWLQRQDRVGMYASVETRVPFCNIELFEYVNAISFSNKTMGGQTSKYLLKKIAEKYLDPKIVHRKKIGFGVPLEDWFRDDCQLGFMLKYMKDDLFKSRLIYDHNFVDKLIADHLSHKGNYGRALWTILNVELWHRIFIDRSFDSLIESFAKK